MGYGGSLADAGRAIGKSVMVGLTASSKEDKLGLDTSTFRRSGGTTRSGGRPEIQKFVGALHGREVEKGIFFTTSTFTKDARE